MSKEEKKPYISKLVVKAGKTTGPDYEIEFNFTSAPTKEEFEGARKAALDAINAWQNEVRAEEFDKLPWRDYKTKEPVGTGHTGWIMWERDNGADLAKLIRQAPAEKLKLGQYEFTFSGKEKQFISRKVIEPATEEPQTPEPPAPAQTPNGAPQP